MRALLLIWVVLSTLVLAGCWQSKTMLLRPEVARQPVPNDEWTTTKNNVTTSHRLNKRSDGRYDYQSKTGNGAWKSHVVLVNHLGLNSRFVLYAFGTYDESAEAYVYGVVGLSPDGSWRTAIPDCDGFDMNAVEIAERHGAGSDGLCTDFTDGLQLMAALHEYANAPGAFEDK